MLEKKINTYIHTHIYIYGEFGNSWLLNPSIKNNKLPTLILHYCFYFYKPVLVPFSLFEKALAVALVILLQEFPRETDDNNQNKAHEL